MTDDDMGASGGDTNFLRVLLPVNRSVSLWVSLYAFSLLVLGFTLILFIWFSEVVLEFGSTGGFGLYALAIAAILGAGANGYFNDDLLVSLFIAVAPLVGYLVFTVSVGAATDLSEAASTGQTATVIGIATAVIGVAVGGVGVWAGRKFGGGRSSSWLW